MASLSKSGSRAIPIKNYFKNAYKYRYLFQEIVRKNVKLQYRNSYLGMFWTFLQPLLTMIVLTVVFSQIFSKASLIKYIINYPVYLLTGRLLYEFFTQSTKRAMRSIRNSASVIKKVYVPKYVYPVSNTASTFVTSSISMLVLVFVMAFFMIRQVVAAGGDMSVLLDPDKLHFSWTMLLAFVPFILCGLLSLGAGMILSVLNVFFKDVEYIYDVFCTIIFYMTPIMYCKEQIKSSFMLFIFKINPLYSIVDLFRGCVLFGNLFTVSHGWAMHYFHEFLYALVFSIVLCIIGFIFFYKKQDKFILHI